MSSSTAKTSNRASKRPRTSTPTPRRTWSSEEELTLIDGLKDLCVKGWRGDNGTFRQGYLMELELYIVARLPNSGLKALPHGDSKIRAWKKNYASISLLKSRSGLGFQYSDGTIIVDDPKSWDDFVKIDPNAKSMNLKKWPLFQDWEEIFGKDRATGEFAEGPQDAVEEMEAQEIPNNMCLGFPLVVVDEDDVGDASTNEGDKAAQQPDVSAGAAQSPFTTHDDPNASTGAARSPFPGTQGRGSQQSQHGNNSKASSSKASSFKAYENDKYKRRKTTTENENETVLKGLMEMMKQFNESHDMRMGALVDKLGEPDLSAIRGKIFSIIASPAFELYSSDQRFKAAMGITKDEKRMEYFLSVGELDGQTMAWMIINDQL